MRLLIRKYREHVKDLSCISKDFCRIVIVDNNPFSFLLQPVNGIPWIPFSAGQPHNEQSYLKLHTRQRKQVLDEELLSLIYFFADDSYLFFRATVEEALCIKDCLNTYEIASGQQINLQKSSIQFSRNTSEEVTVSVSQCLQVPIRNDVLYLGLPKVVARIRGKCFNI